MSNRRELLGQVVAAGAAASTMAASKRMGAARTQGELIGPIKLAIVGAGQISLRYLKPGSGNPRVRFVATAARTLDSARGRASEFSIRAAFDDFRKMYDTAKPDAVIIAVPTAVHAEAAIAALERRIHVLCEKPMAMNLEECQAMVAAAKRSGAVFLALPYDANPATFTALDYLNEETLGVFAGAEANLSLPGVSRDNWYYDIEVAGGGAGLDTLVYPVSKLITLLVPAKRVGGFINTLIPERILGDGKTIDRYPPPATQCGAGKDRLFQIAGPFEPEPRCRRARCVQFPAAGGGGPPDESCDARRPRVDRAVRHAQADAGWRAWSRIPSIPTICRMIVAGPC